VNSFFNHIKLYSLVLPIGAGMLALSGCHNDECGCDDDRGEGHHAHSVTYVEQRDTAPLVSDKDREDGSVALRGQRDANDRIGDANRLDRNMARLDFFAGSWNVELHKTAAATLDIPTDSHGTYTFKPSHDGSALTGQLEMQGDNNYRYQKTVTIATTTPVQAAESVDERAQSVSLDTGIFTVSTSDSKGKSSVDTNASFDGTRLTILGEDQHEGKTVKTRTTYTKISNDRIDFSVEKQLNESFEKTLDGTLTRIGTGASDQAPKI